MEIPFRIVVPVTMLGSDYSRQTVQLPSGSPSTLSVVLRFSPLHELPRLLILVQF